MKLAILISCLVSSSTYALEYRVTISREDQLVNLKTTGTINETSNETISGLGSYFVPVSDRVETAFSKLKVGDSICLVGAANPVGGGTVFVRGLCNP